MKESDVINLEAHPIHEANNPARTALVERCRKDIEASLCCAIPEIVTAQALQRMSEEALALQDQAFHNNAMRNCYLHRGIDPDLPDNHPRNIQDRSSVRMLAYDQIPEASPLKTFYHSQVVKDLVAEIIGAPTLFDNEDPYQPVNYVCYRPDDESSWHFDADNSFTMTLMVQAAESGGVFQMSPDTRTDDDQNYDHVSDVLAGKCKDSILSLGRQPGELCIFRGCNSLHRVTPVSGDTLRIMGVFVYESMPGVTGDPKVNATIYGERAT
jgi:predicted 2-oxoglutarate/Fe(II)-dependent dioxygenase YbiX